MAMAVLLVYMEFSGGLVTRYMWKGQHLKFTKEELKTLFPTNHVNSHNCIPITDSYLIP